MQEDQIAAEQEDFSVQYEIQALEQAVNAYGFSYLDLVESSPKAQKTKSSCKAVIRFLLSSPVLIADMQQSKMLPIKIIEKKSGVPRKIIERHRKYIVTAVEILSGDYPHLAEYFAYIKEEDEK
ncbi:MAG: hypothetical protein GX173_13725 [Ruminococcaceae bacterium]|nr:hypothetical protein [Oscillospiraceae bacterium]